MAFASVVISPSGDTPTRTVILPADTIPSNISQPLLSGVESVGQTITCSTGTWAGIPAPTFTYQWRSDGVNLSGQTASMLILSLTHMGTEIDCVVTATNILGSATATSDQLGAIGEPEGDVYPVITSLADQTVLEGEAFSIDLTADESVVWTIVGGADAAVLAITDDELDATAFNYDLPLDADADNVYEFTVRATSVATGLYTDFAMTLTVLDVQLLLLETGDALLLESGDRLVLEAA